MNSMTGFGRAGTQMGGREVSIEIKSVNHRYLDISFRLPRIISFAEEMMRKTVTDLYDRGKFEISVSYKNHREDKCVVEADIPLAKEYLSIFQQLQKELGIEDDTTLSKVALMPNVINMSDSDEDEAAVTELLIGAMDAACESLSQMRSEEGASLKADFDSKLEQIEAHIGEIKELAPIARDMSHNKLVDKMKEYYTADESIRQRVLTEAALIADKHAIDEELVRMDSHISQFRDAMEQGEAVGRKMDFIVQELNREINTIGNKAQGTEISALVILCKSELEKLREQVQNIE